MPKATVSVPHFYSSQKFQGVSLGVDPDVGSADSEHSRLTNREIIFEDFQPM